MILVRIELHSAVTGKMTTLGQLVIANDGTGTREISNYHAALITKDGRRGREVDVKGHRRLALSVWVLVGRALAALYRLPEPPQQSDLDLDPGAKEGAADFIPGRVC